MNTFDQLPLVSVVLPTFNRASLLHRSISSILNQSMTALELIVVDDGSQDETVKVVESFADSRINFIKLGKNYGGNYARNRGIQASRANYVAFLDSDDEWLPTKLERQLARLEDDRISATVVYSQYYEYQEWTERTILLNTPHEGDVFQFLLKGWCPALSTFIIQRAALLEIGGFDETLPSFQDYDLFLRLAQKGNPFIAAPEPLVKKYVHKNHQVSGNWASKLRGFEIFQSRWSVSMKETLGYFGYRRWVANHLAFVCFRQLQSKIAEGKRLEATPYLLNICRFLPWSWRLLLKGLTVILIGESVYGSLSRAKNAPSDIQEPAV